MTLGCSPAGRHCPRWVAVQGAGNLWPAEQKPQSIRAVRRRSFRAPWLFELTFSARLLCFTYVVEDYSLIFWHSFIFHKGKKGANLIPTPPTWLLKYMNGTSFPPFPELFFFSESPVAKGCGCFSDKKISPGATWVITMGHIYHALEFYSYNCY